MEFFSNKYLYYFTCLVADLIYLIWFMWYMFFSKKLLQKIVIFILVYVFLTLAFTILYFYLGSYYAEDLGITAINVAKWSRYDLISIFSGVGVFLAPIAVLLGFNIWKEQQFENSKIKAIESIKSILVEQESITLVYRLTNKVSLIKDGKFRQFEQIQSEWSDSFEIFRRKIMSILSTSGFYFKEEELNQLYELNNKTINIYTELRSASFDLIAGLRKGVGSIMPKKGEPDDQNILTIKRIYLIEPNFLGLKPNFDENDELILMCKEFEKLNILDPSTNFVKYLNKILKEIYKS